MTPLYPEKDPTKAPPPDDKLLDPEEAKVLASLTDPSTSFGTLRKQVQTRVQSIRAGVEFLVDHLAHNVHALDQGVATSLRQADKVLAGSSARLKKREEMEKAKVGTKDLPTMEVLRSLGRILPDEGSR